ncbi:arginine ABC transporter ATP-binding protein [Clostridium polyendosporum]|uniref:Arginine ABC transporter ATP-binding protein n=1 Tax=Clostridium polyendosporum TaxID=69208 RepID=A0A919VF10_9CLOT|nr:amino acid ABC transporter ATP-binding protein [Clostridium polyendosporum]GIM29759.1 arginine ABC transporter ATP-binding protein [Clostridium polyendosporum]
MIKVENLHKSYNNQAVLKGIDLEINNGEIVVVIGPSGTGKSTFLRCLNYLESADKGIITIGDITIDSESATKKQIHELRKNTSMVFQNYNLFKNKTVLENVMEALLVVKRIPKNEAKRISEKLLVQVGLIDKVNNYPSQLSGGQQQRVGIARAMALKPEVILFDEPTSALDPEWVGEVLDVIKNLASKNLTMIIVTHEMSFAKEIANKVVFMDGGKVVECGTPEEIFEKSTNERVNQFLSKFNNRSLFSKAVI